jgi:hypothetical protein
MMKYHSPTNQIVISIEDIKEACASLRWAIKHIRIAGHCDPRGYVTDGALTDTDFAEGAILDAANALGIDLGATRRGQLDVSNA